MESSESIQFLEQVKTWLIEITSVGIPLGIFFWQISIKNAERLAKIEAELAAIGSQVDVIVPLLIDVLKSANLQQRRQDK